MTVTFDKYAMATAEYSSDPQKISALLGKVAELEAQLAANQAVIEKLHKALCEIAGSKSLTATPTQFYQHLQKLASNATLTGGLTELEQLKLRDSKRDAALLRLLVPDVSASGQGWLENLAKLRESGEWEPEL